jgi:CheY-like chemotaxis protein
MPAKNANANYCRSRPWHTTSLDPRQGLHVLADRVVNLESTMLSQRTKVQTSSNQEHGPVGVDSPRTPEPSGTLLIVDDEESILSSLRRLMRRDGYRIVTANDGATALELLDQHPVDVIVTDQRMPKMTGTEFLRRVRERFPDTIRIVLSGYTELDSVTSAINDGAVYKFLTKPWEDDQLRANISEAFHRKKLDDENRRLHAELAVANSQLASLLKEREHELQMGMSALDLSRRILATLPCPIIGLDNEGLLAFINEAAEKMMGEPLLGTPALSAFPSELNAALANDANFSIPITFGSKAYRLLCTRLDIDHATRGRVLTFLECSTQSS